MVYNVVLHVVMETGFSKNWFSANKPTWIQPILTFQHVLLLLARSCMNVWYTGKRQLHACHGGKNNIQQFTLQIFRGAVGCHSFEIDICLAAWQKVIVFAESMWGNGNFTPRPETQTCSIVLFHDILWLSFKLECISTTAGNTLSTVNVRASKKRQQVVFYTSVFMSSHSEWFGFSAVMLLQGYRNIISRDDAVREPIIPVISTLTCTWSCTSLPLKLPDKWQQSNDIKWWVCFRLCLKLQDKAWADLQSSQRHNYFVSVCVLQLTITIFTAQMEIQENCCCD